MLNGDASARSDQVTLFYRVSIIESYIKYNNTFTERETLFSPGGVVVKPRRTAAPSCLDPKVNIDLTLDITKSVKVIIYSHSYVSLSRHFV